VKYCFGEMNILAFGNRLSGKKETDIPVDWKLIGNCLDLLLDPEPEASEPPCMRQPLNYI